MRLLKRIIAMQGIFMLLFGTFPQLTKAQAPSPQYEDRSTASYEEENGYDWQFESSMTFSTGEFWSDSSTDTLYWPFSIQRFFEPGDVTFTVPLLFQDAGPGVSAIGGRPFETGQNFFGGDSDGGIGDLLLKGRFYLLEEENHGFNLSPIAQIKFPTADDDDGLGTGEFDETVGLESSKRLADDWTLYGDIYFTHIGDPPGINLDNEIAFDVGVGYDLSADTQATLFYAERTALLDSRDNPRDIILGLNHDLAQDTNIYGNLGFGVSDGSPDVSATIGLAYLY